MWINFCIVNLVISLFILQKCFCFLPAIDCTCSPSIAKSQHQDFLQNKTKRNKKKELQMYSCSLFTQVPIRPWILEDFLLYLFEGFTILCYLNNMHICFLDLCNRNMLLFIFFSFLPPNATPTLPKTTLAVATISIICTNLLIRKEIEK